MKSFAAILILGFAASSMALPKQTKDDITSLVEDCGSTGGQIVSVTMENCDPAFGVCEAPKGETVRGVLTFAASKSTASLTCKIFGIIAGIPIPFPGGCPVVDGCTALTSGDCPIEAGETFNYSIEMFIDNSFPSASVTGKWTLKGADDSDFVCFTVPIQIVN